MSYTKYHYQRVKRERITNRQRQLQYNKYTKHKSFVLGFSSVSLYENELIINNQPQAVIDLQK